MKIVACIFYAVFTLLYLLIGDYSRYWGGFYMVTQFAFIGILCGFILNRKKPKNAEQLFLAYSIFQTLTLSIYTLSCIWADPKWVLLLTPWVASILGVVFVGVIIYAWDKYRYELR